MLQLCRVAALTPVVQEAANPSIVVLSLPVLLVLPIPAPLQPAPHQFRLIMYRIVRPRDRRSRLLLLNQGLSFS